MSEQERNKQASGEAENTNAVQDASDIKTPASSEPGNTGAAAKAEAGEATEAGQVSKQTDKTERKPENKKPDEKAAKAGKARPRSGNRTRFLILILVALLAGLGWLYQEQRMFIAELHQQQMLQELGMRQQQAVLAGLQEGFAADLLAVQQALGEHVTRLDEQRQSLQSLNQEVVSLRLGISNGQANRDQSWLLSEAASSLRLAQQYLNLAADTGTAVRLYQGADELLREITDPAITALRASLAADIRLLQAIDSPDIGGLYQQLSMLAEQAAELPLSAGELPERFTPEAEADGESTAESTAGLLATLRAELNQYFTVRRIDEPAVPLLRPEDMQLIRQNLQLQLEQAKLALLRGQQTVWQQSLASVQGLLLQYAAGDSQGQQILASIETLQALNIRPAVPALSNSLAVLQDLLTAGEGGQ